MSRIYKNQSSLKLMFSTGTDITGYTTCSLNVKYPDGSTTTWTCTVSDASTGAFYCNSFLTATLKTIGAYKIQPKIIFSDSTTAYGETVEMRVYNLYE